MILGIIIVSSLLIFFVAFICARTSDFGESADTLTDEEYEETCKAYQEYWDERSRI